MDNYDDAMMEINNSNMPERKKEKIRRSLQSPNKRELLDVFRMMVIDVIGLEMWNKWIESGEPMTLHMDDGDMVIMPKTFIDAGVA